MRWWCCFAVVVGACATPSPDPAASTPGDAAVSPRDPAAWQAGAPRSAALAQTQAVRDAGVSDAAASLDASMEEPPDGDAGEPPDPDAGEPSTITIATFNIQILGPTKASKPDIMAQLAEIIRQYDVVTIQEIKDVSGEAPVVLLDAVNEDGDRIYEMLLSPRTGLQPDDDSSQEQYAVLYDSALIEALPGDVLFDDMDQDLFQREPYVTHLRTRDRAFSFVLIGIHTRPDSAVAEIAALHDVMEWSKVVFPDEDDFIALGDFNAGCNYASPEELDALDLRGPSYFWIVPDDSDSNVSPNTACAYDRIVMTIETEEAFTGNWGVDQAFTDSAVSDHWPVWAELYADTD